MDHVALSYNNNGTTIVLCVLYILHNLFQLSKLLTVSGTSEVLLWTGYMILCLELSS